MSRKPRNSFYRIRYAIAGGPSKEVVVRGQGGKARIMKLIKEVHSDWWIDKMERISKPDWIEQAD